MSASNPATAPIAVFYRRTLIELDKARVELISHGAASEVVAAVDVYRAAVQAALHTQGVSQ